jgi:transcriptional regulator with XRE-family HTH domain
MNTVERVRKICSERGIAISKLEKECGFGNAYIAGLKKGSIPNDRLKKISQYLNLPMEYLTTGEESSEFSDESAHLISKIRNDVDLENAIKKILALSDKKKKHVFELIDLLSEE